MCWGRWSISARSSRIPPIVLLTSLAKGADQLVAEVFAEYKTAHSDRDVSMRVIRPMSDEKCSVYKKDNAPYFAEISDEKYSCLLPPGKKPYVVPQRGDHLRTTEEQFAETARFISDNSIVYIALWDGKPARAEDKAGTAVGVRDSLLGVQSASTRKGLLTMPENRPIYHIYTPRPGEASKSYDYHIRKLFPMLHLESGTAWYTTSFCGAEIGNDAPLRARVLAEVFSPKLRRKRCRWYTPLKKEIRNARADSKDKAMLEWLSRYIAQEMDNAKSRERLLFEQLEKINCYNKRLISGRKYVLDRGKRYGLFPDIEDENGTKKKMAMKPSTELVERYFDDSDQLAIWYRDHRRKSGISIILLAGLAYLGLGVYSDMIDTPFILYAYCAAMLLAWLLWYRGFRKRNMHNSYVDYRVLAEGLRVQGYWYEASIRDREHYPNEKDPEGHTAYVQDYYLNKQKNSITWVRFALRAINLEVLHLMDGLKATACDDSAGDLTCVRNVCTYWLGLPDEQDAETKEWVLGRTDPVGKMLLDGPPGQAAYFQSKVHGKPGGHRRADRLGVQRLAAQSDKLPGYMLICTAVVTVLLVLYVIFANDKSCILLQTGDIKITVKALLQFLVGAFPIAVMMFSEHGRIMGYVEDTEHFSLSLGVYKRAIDVVSKIFSSPSHEDTKVLPCRDVLFAIGTESLQENADWAALNVGRAPEVPN